MSPEQAARDYLKNTGLADGKVYFAEADTVVQAPYIVVHSITPGRASGTGAYFPAFQLSCYGESQYAAIELADMVVNELDRYTGILTEGVYANSMRAVRNGLIRNDDGSYLAAVELKFNYKE